MGRDKALLALPDGQLLWERQLAILQALEPSEVFISGPLRSGFPPSVPRLDDETPGLGPLGGIVAALGVMNASLLIVLAIDLPAMTTSFLRVLIAKAAASTGVVPRHRDTGLYEPLAAVYPAASRTLAQQTLQQQDRSLQSFLKSAGDLFRAHPIAHAEKALFANWNHPVAPSNGHWGGIAKGKSRSG